MCSQWVCFVVCGVLMIFLKIKKVILCQRQRKEEICNTEHWLQLKSDFFCVSFSFLPVFEGNYLREHQDKFLIIQLEIKNHMDMAEFEMMVDYGC